MSNLINKIKEKTSSSKRNQDEQRFTIQPHPAVRPATATVTQARNLHLCSILQKTNNPADVEGPQPGGGLTSNPEMQAHHARGPYVPSKDIKDNLEQPTVSYAS
jgi:hypothetical protein